MKTYYHVTPNTYQTGSDLMCFDVLGEKGYEPHWKWDCDFVDTDVVCLFDTRDDATDFIDNFLVDGILLRIDVPDDDDMCSFTKVSEGYTAVYSRIPAEYISVDTKRGEE